MFELTFHFQFLLLVFNWFLAVLTKSFCLLVGFLGPGENEFV